MQPVPYLFFNGTCREAMETYARILGAETEITMLASDGPPDMPVPEDKKDWIMHATLKIDQGHLMMSDNVMGTSDQMSGSSVLLSYPSVTEAKRVYDALAEGGTPEMPFEPTFWSAGFGTLTDRFGIRWMIGTDAPPAA
jgi:PhnB protein